MKSNFIFITDRGYFSQMFSGAQTKKLDGIAVPKCPRGNLRFWSWKIRTIFFRGADVGKRGSIIKLAFFQPPLALKSIYSLVFKAM